MENSLTMREVMNNKALCNLLQQDVIKTWMRLRDYFAHLEINTQLLLLMPMPMKWCSLLAVVKDLGGKRTLKFLFVKSLGKISTNLGKKASTIFNSFSEILLFY